MPAPLFGFPADLSQVVTTFVALSDGPGAFSGNALKAVRVNAAATALEYHAPVFADLGSVPFTALSDVPNSYTGNANKVLLCNSGETGLTFGAVTLTDIQQTMTPFIRVGWFPSDAFTATTGGFIGIAPTFAGSGSIGGSGTALTTTNLVTSSNRLIMSSNGGAGQSTSIRTINGQPVVWRGNAAGLGGFKFRARVCNETTVAQQRAFMGLINSTAVIPNVDPSTLTDVCGFSYDSAGTQWATITNDASGTATTTALGSSFPVDTTSVYDMELSAAPNASGIDWKITNVTTGATTSGTFSTDLPTNTAFLTPQMWCNPGSTAAVAKFSMFHFFLGVYG